MAPGAFSILAPFLGRKSKKYEKLQTDDPERRRQEATQEEINRLNNKIDRLVHSMSRDDIEKADNPEEECVVCCQARSVMQVAPCGHQCQCRLCFVQNIQDAVANRDLPLRCLICNAKILRVKNNSKYGSGQDHPVHNGLITGAPKFPKSVSGYSLQQTNGMPHSASNYSMSSGVSSMSTSSFGSGRSVKSNSSIKSNSSVKSNQSNSSWFSIGSLSNFQAGKLIDSNTFSRPLRAHSLSSAGKARPKPRPLPASASSSSIKSWTSATQESKTTSPVGKENQAVSPQSDQSPPNQHSPKSIDSRIRAIQGYVRVPMDGDEEGDKLAASAPLVDQNGTPQAAPPGGRSRLQMTRDNFRRSNSEGSQQPQGTHSRPGLIRRLTSNDKHHSRRFSKSPDLAETTFTMTTIEEENEISISLKNLAQTSKDDSDTSGGSTN